MSLTGMLFCQEVQIWMPYISPQSPHQHEVVVRTFSGQSWNDLKTRVKQKRKSKVSRLKLPVTHFVPVPLFGCAQPRVILFETSHELCFDQLR